LIDCCHVVRYRPARVGRPGNVRTAGPALEQERDASCQDGQISCCKCMKGSDNDHDCYQLNIADSEPDKS